MTPTADRQREFALRASKLTEALDRMAQVDLSSALMSDPFSGAYGGTNQRARRAIELARTESAARFRTLRATALELARRDQRGAAATVSAYRFIEPGNAVIDYLDQTIPAWAMAIGLDVLLFLFLLGLVHMHASVREEVQPLGGFGDDPPGLREAPPVEPISPTRGGELVALEGDRKRHATAAE